MRSLYLLLLFFIQIFCTSYLHIKGYQGTACSGSTLFEYHIDLQVSCISEGDGTYYQVTSTANSFVFYVNCAAGCAPSSCDVLISGTINQCQVGYDGSNRTSIVASLENGPLSTTWNNPGSVYGMYYGLDSTCSFSSFQEIDQYNSGFCEFDGQIEGTNAYEYFYAKCSSDNQHVMFTECYSTLNQDDICFVANTNCTIVDTAPVNSCVYALGVTPYLVVEQQH